MAGLEYLDPSLAYWLARQQSSVTPGCLIFSEAT